MRGVLGHTPDFQSFVTKLPKETIQKIKFDRFEFFKQAVQAADLTCDYFAVFDRMADILVSSIFE